MNSPCHQPETAHCGTCGHLSPRLAEQIEAIRRADTDPDAPRNPGDGHGGAWT